MNTKNHMREIFSTIDFAELATRLDAAQIAWARVSDIAALSKHPQLRRTSFGSSKGDISIPALAASYTGEPSRLGDVPELGQHTDQVRREFVDQGRNHHVQVGNFVVQFQIATPEGFQCDPVRRD